MTFLSFSSEDLKMLLQQDFTPTWMLVDDIRGVFNDLVVLLHTEQTLAVVKGQSVCHFLQLQPRDIPCLLLEKKALWIHGCSQTTGNIKNKTKRCHLCLHILYADDGLLVLLRGLLVASLFIEFIPLTVQHWNDLQSLLVVQSPRFPVVFTGLLHLHLHVLISFWAHFVKFPLNRKHEWKALYPDQLQNEIQGFWFLHQLIQVIISKAVVCHHVGHTACVELPVHWVFPLSYTSHTFGD